MAADPTPWTLPGGGEIAEQLDWLTDVLAAPTGPALTRQLRLAPRVTLTVDGQAQDADLRWQENRMHAVGAGPWDVLLAPFVARLEAAAAVGATTLAGTFAARFLAGGRALLLGAEPRAWEVVTLSATDSARLSLASGTLSAWPAGTRVYPLRRAWLPTLPTLDRFTGASASWSASWSLEDALRTPGATTFATYRGYPVLERWLEWSSDPEYTPARDLAPYDDDLGPVTYYDPVGRSLPTLQVNLTAQGADEVEALYDLLYALAGRYQPIWVRTMARDLDLAADAASGAGSIDVVDAGYSVLSLPPGRRDLRIELQDGTLQYRRVTAAAVVSAGVERLVLDSALTSAVPRAGVRALSWMMLARQSADTNKIVFWVRDVARTQLAFKADGNGL